MRLGIFAKTFSAASAAECLTAVASAGIPAAQFNLSTAGLDTVPEQVPDETLEQIRKAAVESGVELAAISGTFNAAHPDPDYRKRHIARFGELTKTARALGIPIITLCSGSRDADDMWTHHVDNTSPAAWADSRTTLLELTELAERDGVTLAVEPELNNVVSSAERARRMLDDIGSPRLKIVIDAANLIDPADITTVGYSSEDTIRESVELLASDIVLAHAKEIISSRAPVGPGRGDLPWEVYVSALAHCGYSGPLVMHGLPESDVQGAVSHLADLLARQEKR